MIVADCDPSTDRERAWPPAAEEFLRRVHKLGLQVTIIGPRPPHKFGSKKTMRLMDRHEVIGVKMLAASRAYHLELRVLNKKTQAWSRLRAEACVTFGTQGLWPQLYDGWTSNGTLTINALSRWLTEQKWLPGREFAFVGSTNQALRWGSLLLDRGARSCYIIEPETELKCWRSHRDRFIAKGGRVLLKHQVQRVEPGANNSLQLYLGNEQGTLIVPVDTIVLAPVNDHALNAPKHWKNGLFYVQRRGFPDGMTLDEEQWFERLDWRELYWRVAKYMKLADHGEAEGALKTLRNERRRMLEYRKPGARRDLGYSGKILDRETAAQVQSSQSVPRSFARAKPVASLECFENIACRACADACPEAAIEITQLIDQPQLLEDKCTGCGACVSVCPAGAAVMIKELPLQQKARYFLPDNTKELWKPGRPLHLLNRRGDMLGSSRVVGSTSYQDGLHRVLEIESTNVHVWEARNFKIPKTDFSSENAVDMNSPSLLKRGWVTLNGTKRLCPVNVPITVALWQLGQRRFEDALYCRDGSCRLCEVVVDGRPVLACRTNVEEGQAITFEKRAAALTNPLCPCKQVKSEEYKEMTSEGVPETIAREITGVGKGTCHGRWCVAGSAMGCDDSRPTFPGYEASPWRDLGAEDITEIEGDEADESFK